MLQFKGNRKVKDVKVNMQKLGYIISEKSEKAYSNGSDYLRFEKENKNVLFNTFNGRFYVLEDSVVIANTSSMEFDNEKWYVDLLNAFYEPIEKVV